MARRRWRGTPAPPYRIFVCMREGIRMERKILTIFLVGFVCIIVLIGTYTALMWRPAASHSARPGAVPPTAPPTAAGAYSAQQDIGAVHTELDHLRKSVSTWEQHVVAM